MYLTPLIGAIICPVIIAYYINKAYKRPKNFPPGPPCLPVYGSYWIILANELYNLGRAFTKLGKKYNTKIVGFFLASLPAVVINDSKLIKEFLFREELDGRSDTILARMRSFWKKLGIFFTDGYYWHVQRRFSLRYMRDYGFGRRDEKLESVVASEIKEMNDMVKIGTKFPAEMELVKGDLVYLPYFFAVPFLNGMMSVFTQETFPRKDYNSFWNLSRGSLLFVRNTDDLGRSLVMTPWIKDIIPELSGYNGMSKGNQYFLDHFRKVINEVLATHDDKQDRHFIDIYIRRIKEELKKDGKSTFSIDQLILVCVDYMLPTATSVEMTLTMLVERMLFQPEIQVKIHEEIDRIVGKDRVPTLDDRRNMPYTESCLREMMRVDTPVPLGLPHRAMKSSSLGGYDIPEDCIVAANFTELHMDKELWGDPENFRPERFIEDGQLKVSLDKSLPFGAGRRLCPGETYARQTMFQVFAGFMQAFRVDTPDGKPLKKLSRRIPGIVTTIPEFWVRVTSRT